MHNLDLVQHFEDFKLPSGDYDESRYGKIGYGVDHDFVNATVYKGLRFNFVSERNRDLFLRDPAKYLPQWGGFCAYGISSEFCPSYPWSRDCMGPTVSINHWTVYKGKLYFFLYSEAKKAFMADIDNKIAVGNERWASLFPHQSPLNSVCVSHKVTE